MTTFSIRTSRRTEFVEITAQIRKVIAETGHEADACIVYSPHTTAAITIQENADSDVVHDMLLWLNQHIPKEVPGFRHAEGNSDSHIKSSLLGSSAMLLIENGRLVLGVYFCEFDGPRERTVMVQVLGK